MSETAFKIRNAYQFAADHGLGSEAHAIRDKKIHSSKKTTAAARVRKGCFVVLFESRGLMEQFIPQYWPDRYTDRGEAARAKYLEAKAENEHLLSGEEPET